MLYLPGGGGVGDGRAEKQTKEKVSERTQE